MFRTIKMLASHRARQDYVAGLSLDRSLAVASLSSASPGTDASVRITELPTESADQVRALSKVAAELGVKGCAASITLAPGGYEMLQIERPQVEDHELAAAARWRVASMLDYPVEEAVLQVFDTPQPNDRTRNPTLNVIAAPARTVRELTSAVAKAGLIPQKVTVAELAIRDFVNAHANTDAPSVTVFLTGRQGLIQVVSGGEICLSRRLGYGLSSVKPVDALETGIHNTLPLELRRTVDYFDSHYAAGSVTKVLAGPADGNFMAFMRQVGNLIGLPVSPLNASAEMLPAEGKPAEFGLPEAYFALGGALSLLQPPAHDRVAV